MTSSFDEIKNLYQTLKTEWNKKKPDFKQCNNILLQIKVGMTKHTFLPTSNVEASQKEYLIARDILEVGVQCSIAMHDIPSFERYMAQLKCYYLDYRDKLPESANQYHLLGLNLLFLLSQNRVAEFHTELELLPYDIVQTNTYIKHPVALEQYLMEGSYNKIFQAKSNVPSDTYNFFMNILSNTLRNEIAECLQKAYKKVSINSATKMLNFNSTNETNDFANKKKWILGQDGYYVFHLEEEKKAVEPLPALQIADYAIHYAKELETIV
ncbi:26S proteasome non-ATPase regulatory subunit 8 [Rhopalosiphum maidis]|uniref:26S proteasome non-ATPase regulatory subunit 8 n=3 Tax=Aphidini TaxID=33387 RepID=A0A2S2P094_SCHGA|nr:26S proteasome non-ATPase regulatory subunit 8 [Melanaphis sacchari]XP_026812624.1 26S proteasome non-ATPase regulatory subunit 8 [Rhopalosiphum maidis]XP_060850975.1 26S proteasome non-ATPase regulatory subunit 8 [Rhopalosiphum padi]